MLRTGILFLIFFVTGCKTTNTPEGIIEKNKMQAVLLDMAKVEEFVTLHVMKDTTKKHQEECMKLYHKVFSIHQTNSQQFLKSLDYYLTTPKVARDMFDSLATQTRRIKTTLRPT